jgi:hypothetical protein
LMCECSTHAPDPCFVHRLYSPTAAIVNSNVSDVSRVPPRSEVDK